MVTFLFIPYLPSVFLKKNQILVRKIYILYNISMIHNDKIALVSCRKRAKIRFHPIITVTWSMTGLFDAPACTSRMREDGSVQRRMLREKSIILRMGMLARAARSASTRISFFPLSRTSATFCREFNSIHGHRAQLWHVAPSPMVGASMSLFSGAICRILLKIPESVATMNSLLGRLPTALIRAVVEPTTSA